MSYAARSDNSGRKPIVIVELILDTCANTFGVAPCTASAGAGGQCYNTRGTCQDVPNYNRSTKTYRFINSRSEVPAGFEAIPCLDSVSVTPSKLVPGQGLGALGSVAITFDDFPHHDRGIDPYVATRLYTPNAVGTFWGKLLARSPHTQGRAIKVYVGFQGASWSWPTDFEMRQYVIEKIDGPDANGKIKVTGKDPLKLADDDRSRCPAAASSTLIADLTETETTNMYVTNGDPYAPLFSAVRIGDEVIYYGGVTPGDAPTGGIFGALGRGVFGSTASAHSIGDVVQPVKGWIGIPVVEVVQDLLEDFTEIPAAFISAGNLDPDGWLASVRVTAYITEPTGVRTLLSELAQQCLFDLWWDEVDQKIRLKALGPPIAATVLNDAYNIIEGSAQVSTDPNARVSQVWLHYDQKDPTKGLSGDDNFSRLYIAANLNSESANEYGSARVRSLHSRWFKQDDASALALASRLVARQAIPPTSLKLELDAKETIKVGDDIIITTRLHQDATGAAVATNYRVVSLHHVEHGHRIQIEAESLSYQGRYARITADTQVNYDAPASAAEKAAGGFIAPTSVNFADTGSPYKAL